LNPLRPTQLRAMERHVWRSPGIASAERNLRAGREQVGRRSLSRLTAGRAEPLANRERAPGEAIKTDRQASAPPRSFRFVDLGDGGKPLFRCSANNLRPADVLLVPHHGGADAASPDAFAMRPRVAIMNNGAKGGSSQVLRHCIRSSRTGGS
jgi:hypothetical protein